MKFLKTIVLIAALATLTACATITPNFTVKKDFWTNHKQTVGVVIGDMPKPAAHKTGNQGLLDIAINDANSSDLDKHLNSLDITKINDVGDNIASYLEKKDLHVKRIAENLKLEDLPKFETTNDDAKKIYFGDHDYRALKEKYGVDKLVVINVVRIGTIRSYYGFIPTGDPSGISHLAGYIVNLDNNQLEWKQAVTQTVPNASGNWDTPPDFTGLTKAMYLAFEQSRKMLVNNFVQ